MTDDLLARIRQAIEGDAADPAATALRFELAGDDELTWLVDVLALPHWFDVDMVYAFTEDPAADGDEIWLAGTSSPVDNLFDLSFVQALPRLSDAPDAAQRFQIAAAQRGQLLRAWREPERREALRELSGRLYKLFQRRRGRARGQSAALLERELLYHRFLSNEAAAREELRRLFETAEAAAQPGICQVLVNYAEEQRPFFEQPSTAAWLDYYRGRLQLMLGGWAEAEAAFTTVLETDRRVARPDLRARAQAGLGDVRRATGDWAGARAAYETSLWLWLEQEAPPGNASLRELLQALAPERLQALRPTDLLELARVLVRMADLAEAMARPRVSLADLRRGRALRAQRLSRRPDGSRQSLRQTSVLYADLGVHQAGLSQGVLTAIVHERLSALAGMLYERAESVLDLALAGAPEADWPEAGRSETGRAEALRRDAAYGLAQVRLAQGKSDNARQRLSALADADLSPPDRAELQLALGDCALAEDALTGATEAYQQAADLLADSWNRTLRARALLRLGRAQALAEAWPEAVANLSQSRDLFAALRSPREEQRAQETLREIARDEAAPADIQAQVQALMSAWPAHHFAYPSSAELLSRVARLWYPVQAALIVVIGALLFLGGRAAAAGLLGWLGLGRLVSYWWIGPLVGLLALILSVFIVDEMRFFRRLVGRLVPLNQVWGSQPGLVTADDRRFIKRDFGGQARIIAWRDVRRLRRGRSDSWVVGEARLTAPGRPGGRSVLYGPEGALTYDAALDDYFQLDALVAERVAALAPDAEIQERKFVGTFRAMSGWLVSLSILVVLVACPATAVLTASGQAWWLTALTVVAWILVAGLGLSLAVPLTWLLIDAIRMRRFLYPRDLPDPPPPEPALELPSYGYEERTLV